MPLGQFQQMFGARRQLSMSVKPRDFDRIKTAIEDTTLEQWRWLMSINLDGVFLGTRYAIAAMKGRGGSIVNLSSIEGLIGDLLGGGALNGGDVGLGVGAGRQRPAESIRNN